MDNIDAPRSLFYKEKDALYDFLGFDSKSLENHFFKKLIKRPFIKGTDSAPQNVLKIFNNACYICTLIYFEMCPSLYLGRYLSIAANGYKDIFWANHMMPATMALVYNWLNTRWYRNQKKFGDGATDALDDFLIDLRENFREWDLKGASEGKDDFYTLVMERDAFKTNMEGTYIPCRSIKEAVDDGSVNIQDIAEGIDYVLDMAYGGEEEDEYEYYVLTKTLNRLVLESKDVKDANQLEYAKEKVRTRLHEFGHWSVEDYNDIMLYAQENETQEMSDKNSELANLKIQIGELEKELQAYKEKTKHIDAGPAAALFLAIAQMTDAETLNKEKLALAVSKIFGWKVSDDGKGHVRNRMCGSGEDGITPKHKETIAIIVEDVMPNLAAKIRKL